MSATAAQVAALEAAEALRKSQADALVKGVGLFRGLEAVDLQDESGAQLDLRKNPKGNAREFLAHRKTYVVVRVGAPPPPEGSELPPEEDAAEPAEPTAAIVPLTFSLPEDPVEEGGDAE